MSNKMFKALSVLCVFVLLAAAGMKTLPFAHAEQYNVGDAEIAAAVRNLEIDWTSGTVHIAYHSGNTILISEKTTGVISEDMRMRWRVSGDTLRIEYDKPGFHLLSIMPHDKELTVTLPKELTLDKANISCTSGDMDIPALNADSLTLKSTSGDVRAAVNARIIKGKLTSGDMELQVTNAAEAIELESTSGDITLESPRTAGKIAIDTTSGNIRANVRQTAEFKADSTSGDIHAVIGETKKAKFESTSGKVSAEIAGMEALEIHTTSGSVEARLPRTLGFAARIETVSGDFEARLPLTKQGKKDYISGDGNAKAEIHTTSGDITISPIDD